MRKKGGRASAERAKIGVERLPEWQIVNDLVAASLSRHTRQIYRSSQQKFEAWCSKRQVEPLPAQADTVAMFLASEVRAGIRPATLVRHLAAIRHAHLDRNEL
jgi:site-specific recombinase XerD